MSKPKAVVTVGVPGCGKSTYAETLVGFININLDACRYAVSGDESNQACTPDALKMHTRFVDQCISNGDNMVISDTNLNAKFRRELVSKLQTAGYEVVLAVFMIPFEVCTQRNESRARVVPLNAMVRMQCMLENDMPRAGDADLVWYIDSRMQAAV